mgnify:CR=1 FL=1
MLVSTAILAVGMHGTAVFLALALVSSTIFFSQYKSMSELAPDVRVPVPAAARRARTTGEPSVGSASSSSAAR